MQRNLLSPEVEVSNPYVTHIIRAHVKLLVDLVNDRHGWTVVGWVRTGKVKDANEEGNREAIDIAAEDVSPHIVYLQPSDPDDVDGSKTPEYKDIVLTEGGIKKQMKEENDKAQELRKRKEVS